MMIPLAPCKRYTSHTRYTNWLIGSIYKDSSLLWYVYVPLPSVLCCHPASFHLLLILTWSLSTNKIELFDFLNLGEVVSFFRKRLMTSYCIINNGWNQEFICNLLVYNIIDTNSQSYLLQIASTYIKFGCTLWILSIQHQ